MLSNAPFFEIGGAFQNTQQTFAISEASTSRARGDYMAKQSYLVDPSHLRPFDRSDKTLLQVVIETPKGSRNKFAFNVDEHVFELKKCCRPACRFRTTSDSFPPRRPM